MCAEVEVCSQGSILEIIGLDFSTGGVRHLCQDGLTRIWIAINDPYFSELEQMAVSADVSADDSWLGGRVLFPCF